MTKLAALIPPLGVSRYEIAVVAAREARRLNEWSRHSGETVSGKVTALSLERAVRREIPFEYIETAT